MMDGIGRDAEKGASDTYGINGTLSRLTVRDNWPLQMKKALPASLPVRALWARAKHQASRPVCTIATLCSSCVMGLSRGRGCASGTALQGGDRRTLGNSFNRAVKYGKNESLLPPLPWNFFVPPSGNVSGLRMRLFSV